MSTDEHENSSQSVFYRLWRSFRPPYGLAWMVSTWLLTSAVALALYQPWILIYVTIPVAVVVFLVSMSYILLSKDNR